MYIDGLSESIKILVATYIEDEKRKTYLDVIQFARAEVEALRALNRTRATGRLFQLLISRNWTSRISNSALPL